MPRGLDEGIKHAVLVLRAAGVVTYESCEGGEGHSFPHPTVKFYGTMAEGWRALGVCKNHGLPVRALRRAWDMEDGEPSGPYWEVVFRKAT